MLDHRPGLTLSRPWVVALAVALLFVASAAAAQERSPFGEVLRPDLLCAWGDREDGARPVLDDATWLPPVEGRPQPSAKGEVAWCRARLEVRPGQAVGLLVRGRAAKEVWVDGERLGAEGAVGSHMGNLSTPVFVVPERHLADGEILVAVRLWSERTWTWQPGPDVELLVGVPSVVEASRVSRILDDLLHNLPVLFSLAAVGALGLFHLAFGARRRRLAEHLVLSASAITLALSTTTFVLVEISLLPLFFGYRTLGYALGAAAYCGLMSSALPLLRTARPWYFAWVGLMTARYALIIFWPEVAARSAVLHTLAVVVPAAALILRSVWAGLRSGDAVERATALAWLTLLAHPIIQTFAKAMPAWSLAADWASSAVIILWVGGLVWALTAESILAALEDLKATHRAAARFVPEAFLRRLGRANVREAQRGDATKLDLTIMFLDLRGFTSLGEANPPEVVFGLVNELLDGFEPRVREHGGFIAQNTGDGFVAVFEEASGAVKAAERIQEWLDERRARGARFPVTAGIGLHSGAVLLGTVGGGGFLSVGMVADAVNLAARVEGLTKLYRSPILLTEETRRRMPDDAGLLEVDRVVVKGREKPIALLTSPAVPTEIREQYAAAHTSYRDGDFQAAAELFAAISLPAAGELEARCRALAARRPEAWDGVWRLDHK